MPLTRSQSTPSMAASDSDDSMHTAEPLGTGEPIATVADAVQSQTAEAAAERMLRAAKALDAPDGPLGRLRTAASGAQAHGRSRATADLDALAREVLRETDALRDALRALAALEQLSAGTAELRHQPLEIGDVLMEIIPRWQARAPDHTFELALPGEVPLIVADADMVGQALDILLDYTVLLNPSGGTVRVDIRPTADDIVVSVRQFEAALADEHLERIFEPFYALPEVPLGPRGGVGLALARAAVHAHGGRVWAERPADGTSTALRLSLPYLPESVVPRSPGSPGLHAAAELAQHAERMAPPRAQQVVLVVERDARMQRYERANLQAQGFRVLLATQVDEAMRLIDLEEPDAILLDLTLTFEPAELVSRLRAYASAPIVVLTRHHDPQECAQVLDAGAADYLAKPFSGDELAARLRVALRAQQAMTQQLSHQHVLRLGQLVMDFEQRLVTVGGRPVALSKTEFRLLRALARNAGMVLAHDVLLERVWGPDCVEEVAFLWVYIRRLRRKIEPDPSKPTYILTVPGIGYRLATPT